jgi:hypothetical protein
MHKTLKSHTSSSSSSSFKFTNSSCKDSFERKKHSNYVSQNFITFLYQKLIFFFIFGNWSWLWFTKQLFNIRMQLSWLAKKNEKLNKLALFATPQSVYSFLESYLLHKFYYIYTTTMWPFILYKCNIFFSIRAIMILFHFKQFDVNKIKLRLNAVDWKQLDMLFHTMLPL